MALNQCGKVFYRLHTQNRVHLARWSCSVEDGPLECFEKLLERKLFPLDLYRSSHCNKLSSHPWKMSNRHSNQIGHSRLQHLNLVRLVCSTEHTVPGKAKFVSNLSCSRTHQRDRPKCENLKPILSKIVCMMFSVDLPNSPKLLCIQMLNFCRVASRYNQWCKTS